MSRLIIHSGNRLEVLLQELSRNIAAPLDDVFAQEIIVTQSPGMARWIAMGLARTQGIGANLSFPFPNAFLRLICERLALDTLADDPFEPAVLAFRVMRILPECLSRKGYEALRSYLEGDERPIRLLQLSQQIAHLFDQYLVFRPDVVAAWDRGSSKVPNGHTWQADLWREVASGVEKQHRISMQTEVLGRLRRKSDAAGLLPERVSVFGVSYLPAFHLQILSALADLIPVNWYLLSPCRQYWGELVSARDLSRIKKTYAPDLDAATDLHFDIGNPLLASLGTQGRDFLYMLAELECDVRENYAQPARRSLLTNLQADILDMMDAREKVAPVEPSASDEDRSIDIHACHSIMREVEVLHDGLLKMFQQDPELHPKDVLVMAPDIDAYAPFIQAVFERTVDSKAAIPYSLADCSFTGDRDRVSDALSAVFDLAGSRLEAEKVTGLLGYPVIRRRFDLDEQDVSLIEAWVKELNIRWGADGEDRQKNGLPFFEENTWKSGIDRLLLGYAMAEKEGRMFAGILPFNDIEGDQARVLGGFMDYFACLMSVVRMLETPKPLEAWATALEAILERMFLCEGASEKDLYLLKGLFADLSRVQRASAYGGVLPVDALVHLLRPGLLTLPSGSGFLTGRVTFCAMLPMRSIPFKVVCLIGLHGSAFPRDDGRLGFDMMASHPRRGDRSRRNDDKYLFLEALISAREKVYISYIGRDIQDNSPVSPSVLVSELIDYLTAAYGVTAERLVNDHPLQAFSQAYFRPSSKLFSFSRENHAAALAGQRRQATRATAEAPLPTPGAAFTTLAPTTLGAFFSNPVRFFLQKRIGLYLTPEERTAEDREPFRLEGLDAYKAGLDCLDRARKDGSLPDLRELFRARGVLPAGQVGVHDYADLAFDVRDILARMSALTAGREPVMREVALSLTGFKIKGRFEDDYPAGLVRARFARFNPRELVRIWIEHLVLCAVTTGGQGVQSVYLCKNATLVLEAVDNSRDVLAYLLRLYREGLGHPLHFFPKSAYAYARQRIVQKKSPEEALSAAAAAMNGSPYLAGEGLEPYISYYFDGDDPLDAAFENLAVAFFQPLFAHLDHTNYKNIVREVDA